MQPDSTFEGKKEEKEPELSMRHEEAITHFVGGENSVPEERTRAVRMFEGLKTMRNGFFVLIGISTILATYLAQGELTSDKMQMGFQIFFYSLPIPLIIISKGVYMMVQKDNR